MLSDAEISSLESLYKDDFITKETNPSFFQWLGSKGTNFTCYIEYLNSFNEEGKLNNKISDIRTIIYALHEPIKFIFFYWTVLIFILYKFNFRKPVMKIVLFHFIFRALGDVLNRFGDLELMSNYFTLEHTKNSDGKIIGYHCRSDSIAPERNPLKWFLTRQIGCTLWCIGEIIGDWYPLLRTRALAKGQKLMWFVYVTCALFNLSKVSLIILHYSLSPSKLYNMEKDTGYYIFDDNKVLEFYFNYWTNQLVVIVTSLVYDFTVYFVLRRNLSSMGKISGFIRKFKTISQFRIYVSVIISLLFLPLIALTIFIKYYYRMKYNYYNLNFSFDEIKNSINNVQYYMIFIDQILLLHTKEESNRPTTTGDYGTSLTNTGHHHQNIKKNSQYQTRNMTISEPLSTTYNSQHHNFYEFEIKEDSNIDNKSR